MLSASIGSCRPRLRRNTSRDFRARLRSGFILLFEFISSLVVSYFQPFVLFICAQARLCIELPASTEFERRLVALRGSSEILRFQQIAELCVSKLQIEPRQMRLDQIRQQQMRELR
jgi:hypothetical protein